MPTMLYDADCGFCARTAGWVPRLGMDVEADTIQRADLRSLGIDPERALVEMPLVRDDGTVVYGHHAWAGILRTGALPQRLVAWLLEAPLFTRLAARVYAWVSANRHRMPGGTPACSIEDRSL